MNIQRLGLVVMTLAAIFLLVLPLEKTQDQQFIVVGATIGFFIYGVLLAWKFLYLQDVNRAMEENTSNQDDLDDAQFEMYLSQKTWARVRFKWVTRITLGLSIGLWIFQ